MRSSAAFILIAVAGLGLSLSGGCGSNAIDGHTRPTLQSINGGAPLHADVFVVDTTVAGMGYIPEESVEVVFTNPPSHQFMDLDESDPYGTFIVDAYTVRYVVQHMLDGGNGSFSEADLPSISQPMHLALPVNSTVTTALVLAPAMLKFEPPIGDLMPGGTAPNGEVVVRAEITFTGHEQGSDRVQSIEGATTILFANYADED
jgi:hypothetical protein